MDADHAGPVRRTRLLESDATPCFLLSSARGGSTLLTRLLDSHRHLASPCEICVPYVVRPSWKFVKSLRSTRKICEYYDVPFPALSVLLGTRRVGRRQMDRLSLAILHKEGKRRLVVKDPRHVAHVERIERLYADDPPRYILLYRDARAVARSFHRTLKRKLERGLRVWREAVLGMTRCEQSYPDRCLAIRFEDLIGDPRRVLPKVTGFLGHEFDPAMLHYGRFPHADDRLDLWSDRRLVQRVNEGWIAPDALTPWVGDEEVSAAYYARPEIVRLNRRLGYPEPVETTAASDRRDAYRVAMSALSKLRP